MKKLALGAFEFPTGSRVNPFSMNEVDMMKYTIYSGGFRATFSQPVIGFPFKEQTITRTINGEPFKALHEKPGDVYYVNGGTEWLGVGGERKTLMISIYGTVLSDAIVEADASGRRLRELIVAHDEIAFHAASLIASIIRREETFSPIGQQLLDSTMLRMVSAFGLEKYLSGSGDKAAIKRMRLAQSYIHEYLTHPLTIGELAGVAGLSAFHFARLFKSTFGMPPMRYVLLQRVELAKSMMRRHPDMPLIEVAYACGFTSQSHFTTMIKRFTGKTPSAWRSGLSWAAVVASVWLARIQETMPLELV